MWPPLDLIIAAHNLGIRFSHLSKVSSWIFSQAIRKWFSKSFAEVGQVFRISRSRWSHKSSMGLRSGDCGGHSIILSRRRLKRCSRNSLQSLDVCLGSLSCWKMNPRPIRCFPEGMAWSSKMVLYACLSIIPDTWTKSPTLLFPKYPHIIIEPPPCFTEATRHFSIRLSPGRRRTKTLRLEPNTRNFDSSDHSTFFYCWMDQFLWSRAHFNRFFLLAIRRSGFF